MEDLYDDESYLDDEDENGLADVETDYDEDKYNEKLQQKMKQLQQKQGSNDQVEPRKTNENISTEAPTNITKAANIFPPKTVQHANYGKRLNDNMYCQLWYVHLVQGSFML